MSIQGFKINNQVVKYDYEALDNLPTIPEAVTVDSTLSIQGDAADAKAVGDELNAIADVAFQTVPFSTDSGLIKYADGTVSSSTTSSHTDYVDLSDFVKIKYKRIGATGSSVSGGIAFYTENKTYISGIQSAINQSSNSYLPDLFVADVPANAKYARFTTWTDTTTYGTFELYGERKISDTISAHNDAIESIGNLSFVSIMNNIAFSKGVAWGGSVGATASLSSSVNRVSNMVPYQFGVGTVWISIKQGYRISFRILDQNKKVLSDSGWITASSADFIHTFDVPDDSYYLAFTGGKTGDAAVTLAQFLENIEIKKANRIVSHVNTMFANVKAVNHRGFNLLAPENTLPAFCMSKKNGFRYVEADVRFTSDGVPVLLHDASINRTARNADGTTISSTVNIADITYEQALAYDFGIWKGAEYAGTKIPTLAQFMELCRNIGLTPRVELNVLTTANATTMFNVIDSCGMARKTEYNCNDQTVLQKILELEPCATIVRGMGNHNSSTVDVLGAMKTVNNTIIINAEYTVVTSAFITQCQGYDIELEVYTVDSSNVILGLDPYISGVTSDYMNAAEVLFENYM